MKGNLLTEHEVAEYLNVQVSTVRKWRCAGKGPPFFKNGRRVYYHIEEVMTYLQTNPPLPRRRRKIAP